MASSTTVRAAALGIEIRSGALRLALRPDLGGAIAGLWHHGVPVLRSQEPERLMSWHDAASFALVPYSNRIDQGRFDWHGRSYRLAPNLEAGPHPLHGVGHLGAWRVEPSIGPSGPGEVALVLEHRGDDSWPFDFEARQLFQLGPTSLRTELSVTNRSAQAAPFGLGWHPYFPKRARSRLHVECSGRWEIDASKLPTQLVPQPGVDADIAHLDYDHGFEGWIGAARIRDERFALTLRSSLTRLVLYTPQAKDYFCVEPVSHVANAINQPAPSALGLVTLQPGQSQRAWMTLEISTTR
ncbi:MAG TPA: aldose 1-epimerase [Burkholderiaceae bacterium]|nr:aldose 1-epimerase [Burkholderiaceae bacterium]